MNKTTFLIMLATTALVAMSGVAVQSPAYAARRLGYNQAQATPGACCLNTADQQGCDELTPADCGAAGGVVASAPTCEPDPCPGGQVEDGQGENEQGDTEGDVNQPGTIACCLNTADQQGCADLTSADCGAAGGVDAGTGTCDPDPCPGGQDTTGGLAAHHRHHHHH